MVDTTCVVALAGVWLYGWSVGREWCRRCGVGATADVWMLGCIVPTAAVLLSTHGAAMVSMLFGGGHVRPLWIFLATIFLLTVTRVIVGRMRLTSSVESSGDEDHSRTRSAWWVYLPVLIVAGMYVVFALNALTGFPNGSDTVDNHMLTAVRWFQSRRMDLVVGVSPLSWPENAVVVPTLLMFAGFERLLSVVQLPNGLLAAAAVYCLARRIGARREAATIAACIALSVPIVVFQSFAGYVDLYGAAAWLCALAAVVWAYDVKTAAGRRGLLVLGGLSAGIALGSKTTQLITVGLLGLTVIAFEIRRTCAVIPRRVVGHAALFGAAVVVCSGFWFIRAAIETGNPLYPATVSIGGVELFSGPFTVEENYLARSLGKKLSNWWDYCWREHKLGSGYPYGVDNGVGAAYAAVVPVGLIGTVALMISGHVRGARKTRLTTLIVLVLSAPLLLLTVYSEILRYVLPLLLLAAAISALTIDRLMLRFPGTTVGIVSFCLALTACIAGLRPAAALAGRIRDGDFSRAWYYQYPGVVDGLETGSRVLNLSATTMNFPLCGQAWSNDVIGPVHWKALSEDGMVTAGALMEHEIEYIFVQEPWPTDWPDDLPVRVIFDDTDTRVLKSTRAARIYKVERDDRRMAIGR